MPDKPKYCPVCGEEIHHCWRDGEDYDRNPWNGDNTKKEE